MVTFNRKSCAGRQPKWRPLMSGYCDVCVLHIFLPCGLELRNAQNFPECRPVEGSPTHVGSVLVG